MLTNSVKYVAIAAQAAGRMHIQKNKALVANVLNGRSPDFDRCTQCTSDVIPPATKADVPIAVR
jgi:hypothetical protein